MNRYLLLTIVAVGLFALSGASCPRPGIPWSNAAPRVLPPSPTVEQVIQAVNSNSGRVQSLSSNSATLSVPGVPSLRCSVAYVRPRQFRLRADLALAGPQVDVGSNDQLFWFWVKQNPQPGVYFCRHDQFASGGARQAVPVEPQWLIDALGLAQFDPGLPHQNPYPVAPGRLGIRTIRETPEGPITKVTVVDAASALVMEQHMFDARGQLRASAIAEGHRRDPATGIWMPAAVQVNCPPAQFSMKINLGAVEINRPVGNPELWAMPSYPGSPPIDLCSGNPVSPVAGGPAR